MYYKPTPLSHLIRPSGFIGRRLPNGLPTKPRRFSHTPMGFPPIGNVVTCSICNGTGNKTVIVDRVMKYSQACDYCLGWGRVAQSVVATTRDEVPALSNAGDAVPIAIKALQTQYKGYRFRSRLEARWAVFFDALQIHWLYEPQGYELPSGPYLPDFFLQNVCFRSYTEQQGIWVDVKPNFSSGGNKLTELSALTKQCALLLGGPPKQTNYGCGRGEQNCSEDGCGHYWDNDMVFMTCSKCHRTKVEYSENNYSRCPHCDTNITGDETLFAVNKALGARFEFGEQG